MGTKPKFEELLPEENEQFKILALKEIDCV